MMSSDSSYEYFGGVEGGGTHSKMVLIRSDGKIIAWSDGPCTSHLLVGQEECLKRVNDMVKEAKQKAGLDITKPLKSLGLSMSGVDYEETQKQLIDGMKTRYSEASLNVAVTCDTDGSIATASPSGCIVLIAGTGSNCHLLNPDNTSFKCGGWGPFFGDEGSAYWIAQKAVKIYLDHEDNLQPSPHDVTFVRNAILKHFKIRDRYDILGVFYEHFDKSHIAGLCKELAKGASEEKDKLCQHLFYEAGTFLARHIMALEPSIDQTLLNGGLSVVCVGSVWKSWIVMKEGFLEVFKETTGHRIRTLRLLELTRSSAIGAASIGARDIKVTLPLDYDANATCFFTIELNP